MLRNLTPVVKNLIIINVIVFLANWWLSRQPELLHFMRYMMLFKSDFIIPRPVEFVGLFEPVQLVTHFFSHRELFHILFNMLALASLGTGVEYMLGSKRFLEFYLFCGLVGGILIAFLDPSPNPVLGASGAISGVIVAFAFYFPHDRLSVFFLPPIESRWVAFGIGMISLIFVFAQLAGVSSGGSISHFGHLAGMLAALLYFGYFRFMGKR